MAHSKTRSLARRDFWRHAMAAGAAALAALWVLAPAPPVHAQQAPALDYEYFKTRVQPVFTAKRPGHARCVSCHSVGTTMRLQPIAPGNATWTDEESRKNYDAVRVKVIPGNPAASRLLLHPLAVAAGGDPSHDGGKHWNTQDDPEWQILADWVRGKTLANSPVVSNKVRIIQTNSAGDNVHIIDPATNKIVGEISGIEAGHGAAVAGGRIFISN